MDNFDNSAFSAISKKQRNIFQLPLSSILEDGQTGIFITDESFVIVWMNDIVFDDIFNAPEVKNFILNKPISFFANYVQELIVNSDFFMQWAKGRLFKQQAIYGKEVALKNGDILTLNYIPILHEGQFSGAIWHIKKRSSRQPVLQDGSGNYIDEFKRIAQKYHIKCCRIDNQGRITGASPAFCNFVGYSEKRLLKTNLLELCRAGKKDLFRLLQNRGSQLLNQNHSTVELEFVSNNDTRWTRSTIYFDYFVREEITQTEHAVFPLDLTMEKDIHRELAVAKEEAERTKLEQQQFLASMSHDIRTPLNAIIGMVLLMADTTLTKEQQEYFKVLKNASTILLEMLNSILNFAKIESGRQEVNNEEFDLPEMIRSLISTFSFKLKDENVDIIYEIDPAIDSYLIGDKVLLNQVLMNLLTNAKKFTKKGEIRLSAKLERTLDSSIWIQFEIKDTGIGISEENMKKIFQDFIKADDDVQINYGGFGLGLFICKKLVELLGGKVILKSKEGKGTSFTFSLPFGRTARRLTKIVIEEVPQYSVADQIEGKLLVVEDNDMNLKYLSKLLERYKIEYDVAMDGAEALRKINGTYYDLILMDMKLPKMSGLEVTSLIREEQNQNIATPVILVSAATAGDTLAESKKAGVNDLLPKPYTPQQLMNILRKYLVDEDHDSRTKQTDSTVFKFNPKLDTGYLQKLYSGNSNYAASLFEVFIESAENDWEDLDRFMEEEDWKELKDLVHKIKPNFSMVGMTWLTEMMQSTYNHLKAENYDQAIDLLNRAKEDFEENLPIIKEEYNRMHQFILEKEFPN